jgi:transcriptional regulator with XRE-family HTH domain
MVDSVSAGDMEQREWARAVADNEDIVAGFVAKARGALRAVRVARGLSVELAAEQTGVSTSTLSRLESGGSGKIDLKLMARVALMLGVVPRLDFAVKGAAATVPVGGVKTIRAHPAGLRRVNQPSKSASGFRAEDGDTDTEITVSTGGPANDTFAPSARAEGVGSGPKIVPAAQDPRILDLRIRDLEVRIAAMEHGKPEAND